MDRHTQSHQGDSETWEKIATWTDIWKREGRVSPLDLRPGLVATCPWLSECPFSLWTLGPADAHSDRGWERTHCLVRKLAPARAGAVPAVPSDPSRDREQVKYWRREDGRQWMKGVNTHRKREITIHLLRIFLILFTSCWTVSSMRAGISVCFGHCCFIAWSRTLVWNETAWIQKPSSALFLLCDPDNLSGP